MSMTELRVAVIGAGYFARFHYDGWARIEGVRLVGCCDLDAAKSTEVAQTFRIERSFTDPATMLAETRPDIVDIATPPATHAALIRAALGKVETIICQKAFCTSLDEARAVVAESERAGVRLVVHENFRFQPWHRAIKREAAAGRLGEVYQATFRMRPGDGRGPDAYLSRQPYFQKMERFLIRETGIHFIDTFRFLLGEVTGVMARLARLNPVIAGEDAGLVMFDFASGSRALFDANRLSDHIAEDRRRTIGDMWIEGTGGTLRLDGDGGLHFRAFSSNSEAPLANTWENKGFAGDSVCALQQHVVDHVRAGAPLENTGRDYLRNLEVEEAIYRSHFEKRYVSLTP
jgi:predicted dehydrogenase